MPMRQTQVGASAVAISATADPRPPYTECSSNTITAQCFLQTAAIASASSGLREGALHTGQAAQSGEAPDTARAVRTMDPVAIQARGPLPARTRHRPPQRTSGGAG